MRTRYGVSPWIHEFPSSRRPDFPRFRDDLSAANVVIVGGGLVGCATAYAFATAGLRPIVLEAGRIGHGAAGRGAGLLLPEPGPAFRDVAAEHGVRAARRTFEAWRGGALEAAGLIRRLGIKCGLTPLNLLLAGDRDDEKAVRREQTAREEAGLELASLTHKQIRKAINLDAPAALRVRDAFSLDPYRVCAGLAAAAVKRRAAFFERTPVTKIRHGRKDVEITIGSATIRAATVVIATGTATPVFKPLRRHFKRREMYFALTEPLPAPMRKQLGDPSLTIRDTRVPPRRLRWTPDGRLVLWGGEQAETPARTREAVVVQRTGDLMYGLLTMHPVISGLQPEFGWDASYGPAADGLMYIGPHRNYPHHLFALGRTPDSATGAFLAARLLLRALQGKPEKADAVFGWTR
jgi:glycine/D-amino acid oxidase-like deaminating enzyme